MPLYEYECGACGHRFEIIQKFSDEPPDACPRCGKGPLQRLLSSPAIQFKGTGWYVTDYAGKKGGGEKGGGEKSGGESKPSESKSDAASSDAGKAESKKSDAAPSAPVTKSD